jgi:hypothetical protein
MLMPQGLSNVGALLGAGVRGLTTPQPGLPPLYALLVSIFYEPFFWLFAFIGIIYAWRRGAVSAIDRFFIAWLLLGILVLLLYRGAAPAHSLWLTIPLVGLASRAGVEIMSEDDRAIWNFPSWAPWLLALMTVALLAMFSIAAHLVARSAGIVSFFDVTTLPPITLTSLILLALVVLFFIFGYFLAANIWDQRTATRGLLLGFLIFGGVTSLAAGWYAAVTNAGLAFEPWHLQPTTLDAPYLRRTLDEVARRETRAARTLPSWRKLCGPGFHPAPPVGCEAV